MIKVLIIFVLGTAITLGTLFLQPRSYPTMQAPIDVTLYVTGFPLYFLITGFAGPSPLPAGESWRTEVVAGNLAVDLLFWLAIIYGLVTIAQRLASKRLTTNGSP